VETSGHPAGAARTFTISRERQPHKKGPA
jgi:hypothetical protein